MLSPVLTQVVSAAILLAALTMPRALKATTDSNDACVRYLRAELPPKVTIIQADCEQLAHAVFRATLTHRRAAPTILWAALTGGYTTGARHVEGDRPCPCVLRLFRASLAAAPAQASALLEIAIALYPDCADALAARLNELISGNDRDADEGDFGDVPMNEHMSLPGSPGSPGFPANFSSGGLALPTPPAETSVVNG